ncbi:hypothetical protein FOA43_001507 [Brettanomyces nanus]|uniref:Minichromosome loss protein Mcl1 middle region domain-containing protein n=1 Tax=Eeniella nana TaxID=13502 RepID=A0A875RZU5_EENNA|nr:uncharacterized protein FOA43_001507 [Brettanomyces nanus]QPG74183.1 hypothetical protein FOA43_001507 [Brettanomyces nanus]
MDENVTKVFVSGGSTFVRHSAKSDFLYVCSSSILKVFDLTKPEQEPEVLDVVNGAKSFETGHNTALVASNNGECHIYDLKTLKETATLLRSPLGLTSAVFTHGGAMALCGGLDGKLQLVEIKSSEHGVKSTVDVREQIASLSYNDVGDLAAVSLANGDLAIYSYTTAEPTRLHTFSSILVDKRSVIGDADTLRADSGLPLDDDDDDMDGFDDDLDQDIANGGAPQTQPMGKDSTAKFSSVRPDWHPSGDLLAIPTRVREIVVYDRSDLSKPKFQFQSTKDGSHTKPIIDLHWSPNGKLLASVGLDNKLVVWDYKTQRSVQSFDVPMRAFSLSWNRHSDMIIIGTTSGNIIRYEVESSTSKLVSDEATEQEGDEEEEGTNEHLDIDGEKEADSNTGGSPGADSLGSEGLFGGEDDFIIDDDGAGYTENGKRSADDIHNGSGGMHKHKKVRFDNQYQGLSRLLPYSPGGTPWETSRRYLTINPVGYAWSVKQEGYNTVTVTFFDRSLHREYHFRDFNSIDIASMNGEGILLAGSAYHKSLHGSKERVKATMIFKTHDQSRNWQREIQLQPGEFLTSVSLGPNAVFACSSLGYVRRYSLYGRLERLEKMPPVVACINSSKYLVTVTYTSPYNYSFNLQDLDGKYYQRSESLPISVSVEGKRHPIRGLFFSSDGDPCIVGQDNVILVLSRWRDPLQACWVPILDANEGLRRIATGDNVTAWPLGLFKDQFNFIVVRGSEYPSFPLTLPSEMSVKLPVGDDSEGQKTEDTNEEGNGIDNDSDDQPKEKKNSGNSAEEELIRTIVQAELLNDAITNDDVEDETAEERLAALSVRYDAALLKQVGQSCNEGDISDAFYLSTKLRDDRALAAAAKMAERLELAGLVAKINRLREARMEIEEEAEEE